MNNGQPFNIKVNGKDIGLVSPHTLKEMDLIKTGENSYHLLLNNESYKLTLESVDMQEKILRFSCMDIPYVVAIKDPLDVQIAAMGYDTADRDTVGEVKAPMPGLVLKVLVEEGQDVEEDTPLLILEAMKMENVIKSPGSGKVENLQVEAGEKVEKGKMLVKIS
jgi:biotin carboxyl carrier protein